jgi:hypothetical protein
MTMPATVKAKRSDDLAETFEALKKIYKPFAAQMNVTADADSYYYLESKTPIYKGKPMCFGAVRLGKEKVSIHMMALYCFPEMKKKMSPELKKRMQGKQCFNFSKPDAALFAELSQLAEEGARRFKNVKSFDALIRSQKSED